VTNQSAKDHLTKIQQIFVMGEHLLKTKREASKSFEKWQSDRKGPAGVFVDGQKVPVKAAKVLGLDAVPASVSAKAAAVLLGLNVKKEVSDRASERILNAKLHEPSQQAVDTAFLMLVRKAGREGVFSYGQLGRKNQILQDLLPEFLEAGSEARRSVSPLAVAQAREIAQDRGLEWLYMDLMPKKASSRVPAIEPEAEQTRNARRVRPGRDAFPAA
jgi:hypothetical protein